MLLADQAENARHVCLICLVVIQGVWPIVVEKREGLLNLYLVTQEKGQCRKNHACCSLFGATRAQDTETACSRSPHRTHCAVISFNGLRGFRRIHGTPHEGYELLFRTLQA